MAKKKLNKFIYVNKDSFDKYYNGNVTQYSIDLQKEKEYVSDNIILKRVHVRDYRSREYFKTVKRKDGTKYQKKVERSEKYGLEVFDKETGKKLSITKFRKYFGIGNSEYAFITSDKFNDLGLDDTFRAFVKDSTVKLLVDWRDIDDIKKYKTIYFNGEQIKFSKLVTTILDYLGRIEREFYQIKFNFLLDKHSAFVDLSDEIIEASQGDEIVNAYTDSDGNFILFSS